MPTRPLTPKHVEAAKEITDRWDEMNRKGSCTKEICVFDISQALKETESRVAKEILDKVEKVDDGQCWLCDSQLLGDIERHTTWHEASNDGKNDALNILRSAAAVYLKKV